MTMCRALTRMGAAGTCGLVLSLAPQSSSAQAAPGVHDGRYATDVSLEENGCGAVTVMQQATVVRHADGDSVFTLTHGPLTYQGVLRRDGSFTTRPLALPPDGGVTTTIGITGRFTPAGFVAAARVEIARRPPCHYVVRWVGRRDGSPTSAAPAPAAAEAQSPLDLTPPADAIYAFTGISVIPMDRERVLAAHTVVTRGGRISAVGPDGQVEVPSGAVRVDGRGRFLVPGLVDMHVHLFDRNELLAYVVNGITTVRNLHGIARHLAWRDSLARNQLVGPRLMTAGPIVDGEPPTRRTNVVIRTIAEADSVVAAQKAAGYEFLKIYDNVPLPLYQALAAAARRAGLPMVGHLPTPVGLAGLLATRGQAGIEHVEELLPFFRDGRDSTGLGAMARAFAAAGIAVTPTMTVHASALAQARDLAAVRARPELRYLNPVTERDWGWEPTGRGFSGDPNARERFERTVGFFETMLVPALHHAGVRLLAGTDAPIAAIIPGFALTDEIRAFRRAGLSPWESLRTATANPAEFAGRAGEFGVVAVGASADLVLLGANPLDDLSILSRPAGVMVRGRWFPRASLDSALERLADRYARP